MAPSATEIVQQAAEQVQQNVVPVQEETAQAKNGNGYKNGFDSDDGELPKLETDNHELLKLSGALDPFVSFDATSVIGREFVNVDLAKWLRAPNSDELLRDLAITSESLLSNFRLRGVSGRCSRFPVSLHQFPGWRSTQPSIQPD